GGRQPRRFPHRLPPVVAKQPESGYPAIVIRGRVVLSALVAALALAAPAAADGWLPHDKDATWTYEWTDSVYNPTPTKEKVTVKDQKGGAFTLAWTTADQGNSDDAPVSVGQVVFQETSRGLVNTD